jgi:CheY-like chemotaxis protein
MMSRILKNDGHTVQWAADMAEGLQRAATQQFDLLLCDLGLPDGTGWELMHALRQRGSSLAGIVLSGYGQDQDLERSREAGFQAHLTKPVSLQTLREAIGSLSSQTAAVNGQDP